MLAARNNIWCRMRILCPISFFIVIIWEFIWVFRELSAVMWLKNLKATIIAVDRIFYYVWAFIFQRSMNLCSNNLKIFNFLYFNIFWDLISFFTFLAHIIIFKIVILDFCFLAQVLIYFQFIILNLNLNIKIIHLILILYLLILILILYKLIF